MERARYRPFRLAVRQHDIGHEGLWQGPDRRSASIVVPQAPLVDRDFSSIILPALWALAFGGPEHIIGTILIGGFFRNFFFLNFVMGVNSIGHVFGSQRFETKDGSRNNWFMAWMTFGDGWHNNHHQHPRAASSQIAWWEFDLNGQIIYLWEKMGLVWNVQRAPAYIRNEKGEWVQKKPKVATAKFDEPEVMSADDGGILFPADKQRHIEPAE
nr:fatty acid desaturase [Sphingopyxis sp. BSNA05]